MNSPTKKALDADEVANLLGISKPIVYQLFRRADFPAVKVSARRWIVPTAALDDWLERQAQNK